MRPFLYFCDAIGRGGFIITARSGRRSFFPSPPPPPPFPPGIRPAPAASDAKPFCRSRDDVVKDVNLPPDATMFETSMPLEKRDANSKHTEKSQHFHPHRPSFLSPEKISKHFPMSAKFAASMADVLKIPVPNKNGLVAEPSATLIQEYREHTVLGWSPAQLYDVVADVSRYSTFLPWCVESTVHEVRRLDDTNTADNSSGSSGSSSNSKSRARDGGGICSSGDPMEMTATLTVGFSFFKEQYTSRVLLVPEKKVQAVLKESETQRRCPVLTELNCVWEFSPVPGQPRQVEVRFLIRFAFHNPLYSKLIMSKVVTLMTQSFENQCEKLHGPPSCQREHLVTK
ncbi:hypothetical protein C3747_168g77 [Trypanosoma cruzi]|uniref:Coenzyme Q-binding protein COQ10 START domain-containing protein n=2 Tax=Trypanosoma cruzi TaxID=5693 RepID=Q4DVC2_TRYCC|nr:hypothetical protein, conserved [Trypanosoma cruzi]EAN96487.1 hypothetical protein, conserved [Trypanosoma cruzi]PWV03823.1 hypothetical protein C3747_168g77 [Trypanosoma cruzi]RNC61949.1 putative coenzyme Q-binding protein COQ10 B, mitochondrial-like [Trypanosoma cruzi]|eukprot:XP_818338.1 hypothetical protein [Trypanosoma cruzi strain CL Brener]